LPLGLAPIVRFRDQFGEDLLATKANAAFEEAAQDLIARAWAAETQVVVWHDGKVTKLSPG